MKIMKIITIAIVGLIGASCASIVSQSIYPVSFTSAPSGADVTIENRDGFKVFKGSTPSVAYLSSSAGYMRRERYKVTIQLPEHDPHIAYLDATVNGWYFGNILIGGIIGFLIVDPATGALYTLPGGMHTVFTDATDTSQEELRILDKNNLPKEINSEWLVPLKP
jgi:hypothetical protein